MNEISQAKNAIETLLNSKDVWKGAEAWQRCVIADALITYTLLSNDYQHIDFIESAVRNNSGLSGNDDDLWSAIAALKLFYLTGDPFLWDSFVMYEYKEIANKYWDEKGGGGVWWQDAKWLKDIFRPEEKYKNAITNELWLTFVMLMYIASGNSEYLEWGQKTWDWFKNSGMIRPDNLICDGLPVEKHKDETWTYNQGVILSGLANLYQFGRQDSFLEKQGFSTAAAVANFKTDNGILDENCVFKEYDDSGTLFKGIYMQNLGYFLSVFRDSPSYVSLQQFIENNASYVQHNATNPNGEINAYWIGNQQLFNAAAQGAGIQLYIGAYAATNPRQELWSYVRIVPRVGTSATPASTAFNNHLYSAWKGVGSDAGIYFASMDINNNWSGQAKIPDVGTSSSPALAVFNNRLYSAWKGVGSDAGIYFTSMDINNNWSRQVKIPNVGTSASPALAVFNNRLYSAWKGVGSDAGIYFASMDASGNWTSQTKISGVGTTTGVSLATFANRLYAIWKGVDSDQGIYFASMDVSGNWTSQMKILGVGTNVVPSIVTFNGKLYAAWKGASDDKHIWYSVLESNGGTWSPQTRFVIPGVTTRSPSLTTFNNRIYNIYAGSQRNEDSISFSCFPALAPRGF